LERVFGVLSTFYEFLLAEELIDVNPIILSGSVT
jgi:hypothetical protein